MLEEIMVDEVCVNVELIQSKKSTGFGIIIILLYIIIIKLYTSWQHGGAVASTVALQQEGPPADWLPPTIQRHAG